MFNHLEVMLRMNGSGVNRRSSALAERLVSDGQIRLVPTACGARLVDCRGAAGGIAAGLALAEIAAGGLATVAVETGGTLSRWPWQVMLRSLDPVRACLGCQYAGWALPDLRGDGGEGAALLGSGPARLLARPAAGREALLDDLRLFDEGADEAVLVVETEAAPSEALLAEVAAACGVAPERLTVLFAPVTSLAGSVQVAARSVEVALRRAHGLGFPVADIADAVGVSPLPPPHPDPAVAMGRTNDALIYGSRVALFVTGPAAAARALAEALPSCNAADYGTPFAELYRRAGEDFYALDAGLFSPAEATVTALESGATFRAGGVDAARVAAALGVG